MGIISSIVTSPFCNFSYCGDEYLCLCIAGFKIHHTSTNLTVASQLIECESFQSIFNKVFSSDLSLSLTLSLFLCLSLSYLLSLSLSLSLCLSLSQVSRIRSQIDVYVGRGGPPVTKEDTSSSSSLLNTLRGGNNKDKGYQSGERRNSKTG